MKIKLGFRKLSDKYILFKVYYNNFWDHFELKNFLEDPDMGMNLTLIFKSEVFSWYSPQISTLCFGGNNTYCIFFHDNIIDELIRKLNNYADQQNDFNYSNNKIDYEGFYIIEF